ncbi:2-amino-4-ketopentanoate thiolase beta subunit [subsurface metagenome]
MSYSAVMAHKSDIVKASVSIDYNDFESGSISFDYERMMKETGYTLEQMIKIQSEKGVGNTPLLELKNITKLARKYANPGKGARIFLKDEASNPSGSFKDRRASISVYNAKKLGYKGVIAATSGNYGAAVASQACMRGLNCIILQECYDSKGKGQPEIIEKARKCEAYGAEVLQLSVGPELFYQFLILLKETGYFNASLYTPFGVAGVETLGYEIAKQVIKKEGRLPDAVVATNAGGGNLTGTARGLIKYGASDVKIIGASVNLKGLHMASDTDFNKKSFTTGHTGFGIPFATWPDRADVPRNAARVLRYMDRYVTVNQGEVFYTTEMLAQLEGLERGPAGNTSLAAAFSIAQEMDKDEILVVQETEYTGAGKHIQPQLTFAKENGVEILIGNPKNEVCGKNIVLPINPGLIKAVDLDIRKIKESYIRNSMENKGITDPLDKDIEFLAEETKSTIEFVKSVLEKILTKKR